MLHVTTADGRSFKLRGTEGPGGKQTGKTTRYVFCWGTEKELARCQQRRY